MSEDRINVREAMLDSMPTTIEEMKARARAGQMEEEARMKEIRMEEEARMILDQGTDPIAAAQRYAVTQEVKDSWRVMINGTNNRGIPEPLKELYDGAYEIMLEIIDYEKDLIMRG